MEDQQDCKSTWLVSTGIGDVMNPPPPPVLPRGMGAGRVCRESRQLFPEPPAPLPVAPFIVKWPEKQCSLINAGS